MGKYIPKVSRRTLLLISGLGWFGTSMVLLSNVIYHLMPDNTALGIKLAICFPIGLIFYALVFKQVPKKYINRILNLEVQETRLFDFMGIKGYVILIIGASLSFGLVIYRIVDPDYVFTFQSIMIVPILISAFIFFKAWRSYH